MTNAALKLIMIIIIEFLISLGKYDPLKNVLMFLI